MKQFYLITLILLLPAGLLAQEAEKLPPKAKLPEVDEVLEKFVEGMGGRAAVEKLTSRESKGTFELPAMGATGTVQSWAKAPNKSAITIDIMGFGVIKYGFDGEVAWESNPQTGLRELTGAELAGRKLDLHFYRDLRLKELYTKLSLLEKSKVGEKEVYVVEATPPEGKPERMYFDVESGLMLRRDVERDSPQGPIPIETYLEQYKEVDGVKIPFVIRQANPAFTVVIKFDEVKHNVEIDEAKFAKPKE